MEKGQIKIRVTIINALFIQWKILYVTELN